MLYFYKFCIGVCISLFAVFLIVGAGHTICEKKSFLDEKISIGFIFWGIIGVMIWFCLLIGDLVLNLIQGI